MRLLKLCALAAALTLPPVTTVAAQRTCQPDTSAKAGKLRREAIQFLTKSSWLSRFASLGIVAGDSSQVSIVTSDSLCEAVTAALDLTASPPIHSERAYIIVRFQNCFAAVEADTPLLDPVYILDERLQLHFLLRGT
jgi:hypothetical protein